MESLPTELAHHLLSFIEFKSIMAYRLCSRESNDFIRSMLVFFPVRFNNLANFTTNYFGFVKKVDLQFCRQITDDFLSSFCQVEIINLRGCNQITDSGLKYLSHVKEINLSGCYQITNDGLLGLNNITFIDVSYCPKITFEGFANFNDDSVAIVQTRPLEYPKSKPYTLINKKKINIRYCNNHPFLGKNNHAFQKNTNQSYSKNSISYLSRINIATKILTDKIETERCRLFDSIYAVQPEFRDKVFMKNYEDLLPNDYLYDKQIALNRLHRKSNRSKFIDNLLSNKMDIMIGGSIGLLCTHRGCNFEPNDMDLYLKYIDSDKIKKIESIIYQSFIFRSIVVVRTFITITWLIQSMTDEISSIQLNLMNIKSWAEVFITYHADLTCIGYEILTNKFVYLDNRWNNILQNDTNYFSNILNMESANFIYKAASKYQQRGFICVSLNDPCTGVDIQGNISKSYDSDCHRRRYDSLVSLLSEIIYGRLKVHISDTGYRDYNQKKYIDTNLINYMFDKYRMSENISFSSSVSHLQLPKNYPDIIMLSVYKINEIMNKLQNNDVGLEFHQLSIDKQKKHVNKTEKFFYSARFTAQNTGINHYNKLHTVCIVCKCGCDSFMTINDFIGCQYEYTLDRGICSRIQCREYEYLELFLV